MNCLLNLDVSLTNKSNLCSVSNESVLTLLSVSNLNFAILARLSSVSVQIDQHENYQEQ
jgi:hypothetical protein